ncbi:carbohydrate ABC transporter permease [Rhodobium gokarnense]|uniref:Maltose/maltodextrin transport system permease protein MalG n=1 Tax=Rhodobium gokarnense TaxID=364296 RepID=A0ABT3HB21_9HYPH|nr:carbohydrate ABC transporter permease [Rhodobium gokarnense]MCW2307564.1 ABC-type glycerol-3-phosphate transport system permease component [Rhodobium gokarnense]
MTRRTRSTILPLIGALIITLIFVAPMVWMFLASFKTVSGIFSIPPQWVPDFTYTDNYVTMLKDDWPYLLNSVIVTVGATILCVVLALPAAFGLTNFRFRGRNFLADWILSTRMMPPIAAGVPLYMVFNGFGMLDSIWALIIVYAGFNIPFAVWVAMSFFRRVPRELIEAAQLEGCSWTQTFLKVALPVSKSGIATVATFVFIFAWNELLMALFLTTRAAKTFPVVISSYVTTGNTFWELVAAASVIQAIPPIIFTLIMQRHIVSGLTMGAVKD